jgi:hypothetical protein
MADPVSSIQALLADRSHLAVGDTLGARLTALTVALASGVLDESEFSTAFRAELAGSYLRAYTDELPADHQFTQSDVDAVERLTDIQAPYIKGFASDIANGTGTMPTDTRVGLYADSTHAATQSGALVAIVAGAVAMGVEEQIDWIMDEDEDSCTPCKDAAEGSPYTADTLPGMPQTPYCDGWDRCRCRLSSQTNPDEDMTGTDDEAQADIVAHARLSNVL